jgi:methyl-accepting chemotaxis protein
VNSTLISRAHQEATPVDAGHPPIRRRFMRRLSIGVKLWATTGILAVPFVGLAIFYVQSLTSTLWFSGTEITGVALYQPLSVLESHLAQRSELVATALLNHAALPEGLQPLNTQIDADLMSFARTNSTQGNSTSRRQEVILLQKWQALKSQQPPDVESSLSAHAAMFDAIVTLRNQIGTDWLLILDPDLATYSLLDVVLNKHPDAMRAATDAQIRLKALVADPASRLESARLLGLLALIRDRAAGARDELAGAQDAARQDAALSQLVQSIDVAANVQLGKWCDELGATLEQGTPGALRLKELLDQGASAGAAVRQARAAVLDSAAGALNLRHTRQKHHATIALGGSAGAMIVAIFFMLALSGRISGAIKRLLWITEAIGKGSYDTQIDESGNDEVSRLFAGIAQMQRRLKSQLAQERAVAAETARIKQALDFASANVMVTNENFDIIYVNHAGQRLFREVEAEFRRDLPQFAASAVLGASMDVFHRNPAHHRELLSRLKETYSSNIELGGRSVRVSATPVLDDQGQRIGTLMEWFDRTAEVTSERDLTTAVKSALEGNLGTRISADGKSGFYAVLANSLNQLLDNMCEIVKQVKVASGEVHRGTEELAQGNKNLSQRTEQQASSLEETAASMEQMTSSVRHNADNANQANELARTAHAEAAAGGEITTSAIGAMSEITESSRKINSIIGVIDEIAFQTNLLALNAAVEAARAGEQGRGFAVVATEVRSLAGRSAVAAREIKSLIEESVIKVEGGAQLVQRCAESLRAIVTSVRSVSTVVSEIAVASQEQAKGIDQVSASINQMEEITQQNAALVEQIAAASQAMAQQAGDLNQNLGRFTIASGTATAAGSSVAAVASGREFRRARRS